jgi:hypothetical protein
MARANKALANINDELRFDIPTDDTAVVGVQYPVGGAGTIILEGTMDGGVTWFTIQMLKPDGTAAVLLLAAAGQGYADVSYCDMVRIRMTVAGANNVTMTLATRAAN